jgi:hypothetical protein
MSVYASCHFSFRHTLIASLLFFSAHGRAATSAAFPDLEQQSGADPNGAAALDANGSDAQQAPTSSERAVDSKERPPAVSPGSMASAQRGSMDENESEPDQPSPPEAHHDDVKENTSPEKVFGDPGEIVLSGLLSASVGSFGYSETRASGTTVSIEPAFDYFFARNLSIGAAAFFNYSDARNATEVDSTRVAVGGLGRIGVNLRIAHSFSWYPIVSLGLWWSRTSLSTLEFGTWRTSVSGVQVEAPGVVKETVFVAEVFAPFLVHPAQHFFVGFGPNLVKELSHSMPEASSTQNLRRYFGFGSTVGGWF